jgi:phenylacetate-CoA ligase
LNNKTLERLQHYLTLALIPQQVAAFRRNVRKKARELTKIQEKKLKLIVRHAYDYNPFYHRLYREKGVNPYDIKTIGDFEKIPTVDRKTMQKNFPQTISVDIDPDQCYERKTSGSSGIPLTVLIDRDVGLRRWIGSLRQFFECGGKWTDRQMEFRNVDDIIGSRQKRLGWPFPKYVRVPINRLPLDEAVLALLKAKPEVVVGYPSFLISLAETLDKRVGTRVVFVTGEIVTDYCRKAIESKFCGNLIDTYGCTEVGNIAWECPDEHSGYHLNADSVFVEFIRDEERVSGEEEGEIVLTDLTNMAMPFIRYRIGDTGIPSDGLCSCGRTFPLMLSLKGRSDDFIVLPSGKKISPLALLDLNTMDGILEFRVVQKSLRLIELWTKVRKNVTIGDLQNFVSSVKIVLEKDVKIRVCLVNELPKDESGKMRRIVSEVSQI